MADSDPKGLPYAGGGPTVNDDGTPMLNLTDHVVGGGSDTTSLTSTYVGSVNPAEVSPAVLGPPPGRSAGQNSGTGFAPS